MSGDERTESILVCRPLLPSYDRLVPYLREIDKARFYSNYGPLHERLKTRLADHFGAGTSQIAIANSGTSALIALILSTVGYCDPSRPLCVCPSYTFAATAIAAKACGYQPFFADIDPETWALDPQRVGNLSEISRASILIVVAPYGRMVDISAWQEFSRKNDLPVIFDAAGCFDSLDAAMVYQNQLPVAISLHATKTYSTAEGGLILGGDADFVARAERALNYGFYDTRESCGPSINGKMSEYHAAIGLSELDTWDEKRKGFLSTASAYTAEAEKHGLGTQIIVDMENANPYALFRATDGDQSAVVAEALLKAQIGYRYWYGSGLHTQPEFRNCRSENLTVTTQIAQQIIGLPFAVDLEREVVAKILSVIASAVT